MNWLMPCAPAGLTALGFHPDSCSICAAITADGAAAHNAPADNTDAQYFSGTDPGRRPPPVPANGAAAAGAGGGDANTTTTSNGRHTNNAKPASNPRTIPQPPAP